MKMYNSQPITNTFNKKLDMNLTSNHLQFLMSLDAGMNEHAGVKKISAKKSNTTKLRQPAVSK